MTPHRPAAISTQRLAAPGRLPAPPDNGGAVLVTGGGGFLGRHIVGRLLARGVRVRILGRRAQPDLAAQGVDCRQGDVADELAVRKAMEGVASVIHCAAIPGVGGEYKRYYDANYLGAKTVIDCAAGMGARKFVYTSTPSVVHGGKSITGGDETLPYPSSYTNPYAATKALAEKMILKMNSPAFATTALRPHLIFGPGDTQLIPKLLARARAGRLRRVGTGSNMVSVSYVENVADAHIAALDRLEPGSPAAGKAFFVNEPEPVNCWDFINRIVTGAGLPAVRGGVPFPVAYAAGWLCEAVYRFFNWQGDPPMTRFLAEQLATDHWFRVDRVREALGWEPAVGLDEGVKRTLASLMGQTT